jgi:CO/xanthine dehydrogenase Mo-binding subunit
MSVPQMEAAPVVRIDARAKLTGAHRFPTDYAESGMLWVRLARSPLPHATIRRIDPQPARAVVGVVAVLLAADLPAATHYGLFVADQPILCSDRVRRVGDPTALVIADSADAARAGVDALVVDYEPLPPVTDSAAALAAGAPLLHEGGNVCAEISLGAPHHEVAAALANCAVVHTTTYTTPRQEHAFLEVEGGAAWMEDGRIVVAAGGQNPLLDRAQVAAALGVATTDVRVINPPSGGAFGGKEDASVQIPLALAVQHTGRPCRYAYDRAESLIAGYKRHPFEVTYRSGADLEGRIRVLDVRFVADAGAYTALSPAVIALAAEHAAGGYDIPLVSVAGKAVFTNNGISSAFRGFGNPQMLAGLEQHIDLIAARTGIDSLEVRRRNLASGRSAGVGGLLRVDPGSARAVIDAAAGWQPLPEPDPLGPGWKRGTGLAMVTQGYGLGIGVEPGATAVARLTDSGGVEVEVSSPDMGTGVHTAYAIITGEALGVPAGLVTVRSGDSLATDTGSSNASRSLFIVGNAVYDAAAQLRERVREAAAKMLGLPAGEVVITDGGLVADGSTVSLEEVAAYAGRITVEGTFQPGTDAASPQPGLPHYGYAAGVVEVRLDVDTYTGAVRLGSIRAVIDPGRAINPAAIRSQVEGAIAQGIGFALHEDATYHDGVPGNTRLANYIIPTALDVPTGSLEVTIVETSTDTNPMGVRGIAELGLAPMAPAIANAIAAATGMRFDKFPIRGEDILNALLGDGAAS